MNYWVYILKCADNTYYTGITNNIERRLIEHREGRNTNSYTYTRGPVELVFTVAFNAPSSAINFEKKIKKWSKAKKEALIKENYDKLPELSKKNFKRK